MKLAGKRSAMIGLGAAVLVWTGVGVGHGAPAAESVQASDPSVATDTPSSQEQLLKELSAKVSELNSTQKAIERSAAITNRRLATIRNLLWGCASIGVLLLSAVVWLLIRAGANGSGAVRAQPARRVEFLAPAASRIFGQARGFVFPAPTVVARAGSHGVSSLFRSAARGGRRLPEYYRVGSLIALNLGLLFVALNLVAAPFLPHRQSFEEAQSQHMDQWRQTYSLELLKSLYPGLSDAEVIDKTRSKSNTGVVYEPFIQFRTEPGIGWPSTAGAGVHEAGFRLIGPAQGPWPPDRDDLAIFVFGGSTTIGIGVRDSETIPAQLQAMLRSANPGRRIAVYNFGAPGYFSAVERVYFEKLLVREVVPDVAVFVDGYNDFHVWRGEPGTTWWVREQFPKWYRGEADYSFSWYVRAGWERLPSCSSSNCCGQSKLVNSFGGPSFDGGGPVEYFRDPVKIRQVIERYDANMRMTKALGDAFGVRTLFVMQPVATYKYDGETPLGPVGGEGMRTKWGYPAMRDHMTRNSPGPSFLWCADVQAGIARNLYVDQSIHYNVEGSGLVARCIAEGLQRRGDAMEKG